MGFIEKRGRDRYRARLRLPNGKERSRTFKRRADADRWLTLTEADLARGTWHDPRLGRRSFASWAEEYFRGAVHKRATTLARDQAVYRKHLGPAFGGQSLASMTPLDVRRFVEFISRSLAPATVRTVFGVLKAILNAAIDADLIAASPCRGVKLPADAPDERHRPTPAEIVRIADEVPEQYRPMVYLGGVLGLRWSEVAGLRVGRVDFLRRTLTVTETVAEADGVVATADVKSRSSRRTLPLPPFVNAMLAKHVASSGRTDPKDRLFQAPEGGPLRATNFRNRVWKPAVRAAGLEGVRFHDLRHSAAGLMREVGAHEQAVQQRMGHGVGSRVTSEVYGWVTPASEQAVTEGLEALFSAARGLSAASENEA
jgi:integrase